jgi:predicted RNA-binding protein with PIN domain
VKHYIIDGNNLIGKIPPIKKLQNINKQASRERLAFIIGRYFLSGKNTVSLHFDGHANEPIKVSRVKIKYSGNKTADEKIKSEIEKSKNPKNIIVVTSDGNVAEFARVCSCEVIKSEDFRKKLFTRITGAEEQARFDEMNNQDEFKKLFGVK